MFIEGKAIVKLWKSQGEPFRLGPLDIQINFGDVVLIKGSNGSGKSTLINCLAKTLSVDQGVVTWGKDIGRNDILVMPQNYHLLCLPWYTCFQNLALACEGDVKVSENYCWCVSVLPPILKNRLHNPAYTLSGGEKQAMIMAQVLLANKRVMLLDEPFSNMDVETMQCFIEIIKNRCVIDKCACVIAAHNSPKDFFTTKTINLVKGQPEVK